MVEEERRGLVREEVSCSLWLSILQCPKQKPGHRFKTLASTLTVFTSYCITVFWDVLFGLFVLFLCVCLCIYFYVCVCVCFYECICGEGGMCVHVCVHVCACMCTCTYVCVHVCGSVHVKTRGQPQVSAFFKHYRPGFSFVCLALRQDLSLSRSSPNRPSLLATKPQHPAYVYFCLPSSRTLSLHHHAQRSIWMVRTEPGSPRFQASTVLAAAFPRLLP